MQGLNWLVYLSVLILVVLSVEDAQAQPKEVKFTQEWKGSVDDEALQKGAPEVITTQKALEKVWTAWKVPDKLPKIDFTKEMVVVATTVGSRLNLIARLDDNGNLEVIGMATLDRGPGFRYLIATVSRDGVKTVNKKPLPKE